MRYGGCVDIFDAGPVLEAYTSDLRVVKDASTWTVTIDDNMAAESCNNEMLIPYMVANQSYKAFRSIVITPKFLGSHLIMTTSQATALNISTGDSICAAPLFAQMKEKHHVAA